jgi:glycosyltransferase involved in cell wall biosynthesis
MHGTNPGSKKICHVASADLTLRFLLLPKLLFLKNERYEVRAVCSPGPLVGEIESAGIPVKTIAITRKTFTPFSDLLALARLFFYFKKERFDAVHTHAPKSAFLGQIAAVLAGVPVRVTTIHGLYADPNSSRIKKYFFIVIEKITARCATHIFSQNQEDIATMLSWKTLRPEKITYLGNGIDLARFNPSRFSDSDVLKKKRELGLPDDAMVIGTVGRLVKEKGYLDLFEALKIIIETYPKAVLLAIGPEERQKADRFDPVIVKEYGLEGHVKFLGQVTDIETLYPVMDVFALASHREGFPRSVIEAMAMQKPVVVTDIRGCREEIEDGISGLMVPPRNPRALALAIMDLLKDRQKAVALAEAARSRALEEFDERLVFARIQEAYRRLLHRPLRVCQVTTVDITVRFILWNIILDLREKGYEVSVACSPGPWVPFFREQGFAVKEIPMTRAMTPLKDLIALMRLFFYFRRERFDIVHTHTPKAGVIGRIAARLAGVPIVIHSSHGFYIGVKMEPIAKRIIMLAEKVASYFCDIVISQSQEDVDFAIRRSVISPAKIKLLRYGIDIARFKPIAAGSQEVLEKKKALGLEKKRVIGMVGRFVKEKGYLDMFEAFTLVKKVIPDSALLLVAPKDQKPDALDLSILDRYGIRKDTVLLGYEKEVMDIERLYPCMDVFVLPSFREGFPYSIMEASACAKPVVATDIRGCREAVENGATGMLVPYGNPEELAKAIIAILSDADLARAMGGRGRKKAEREFDQAQAFIRLETEYRRLIEKKL